MHARSVISDSLTPWIVASQTPLSMGIMHHSCGSQMWPSTRKGKVEIEVITKAIEESDELGNQLPKEIPWKSHTN